MISSTAFLESQAFREQNSEIYARLASLTLLGYEMSAYRPLCQCHKLTIMNAMIIVLVITMDKEVHLTSYHLTMIMSDNPCNL